MAELLIVVVVVVALLMYGADRARKLRARARQMAGMNDRLAAAAAKVDEEQHRRQARAMASAELTSVLPAIKRPPLTLPGMAGPEDAPGEDEGEGEAPEAPPPARADPAARADPPASTGPAAEADAAAEAGPADDSPPGERPGPPASRPADETLSMPAGITADDLPVVPGIQVTTEGTLIMRAVPDQGPAPAGETLLAPDGPEEPDPGQKQTGRR